MNNIAKILIVEDEYITAITLKKFLEESGYEIVDIAMSTDEALHLLENKAIDIVLLDINIDDDRDGIWIANQITEKYKIPFIYLTAYNDKDTIQRAIKTNPYGFLTKPFQQAELFSAIAIALKKHNEIATNEVGSEKYLFLKDVDKFDKVVIADINYIESQKNYLLIFTNTKQYKHRATLKDFSEHLPNNVFIRIHRAFIINIHKIDNIDSKNNTIVIEKKSLPISKTYKKKVLDLL